MKPIQQAFKMAAAGVCLANEWRDTAFYTLLAGYAGAKLMHPAADALMMKEIFAPALMREFVRGTCWNLSNHPRLVGDKSAPVDKKKNFYTATMVFQIIAGIYMVMDEKFRHVNNTQGLYLCAMGLMLTYPAMLRKKIGFRDIPDLYFNPEKGMWDWPRKNKGDGPTQTDKMKKWFVDFGKRAIPQAPCPAGVSRGVVSVLEVKG